MKVSTDSPDTSPHVGARLRMVSQWVRDQVYEGIVGAGYRDLGSAHVWVFRYPGPEGMRPSELAAGLQISRQAVNDLMGDLELRGYLVREPDPSDGRARVVRLTAKGRRLEKAFSDEARRAELRIAELLGPRRFSLLSSMLGELSSELTGTGATRSGGRVGGGPAGPEPPERQPFRPR